jgi:hypothetical protein
MLDLSWLGIVVNMGLSSGNKGVEAWKHQIFATTSISSKTKATNEFQLTQSSI